MAQWAAVPYRGVKRVASRGYRLINRMIGPLRLQARLEWTAFIDGLFAPAATIPPKYFYDALGCALFDAICELPEYYLDAHRARHLRRTPGDDRRSGRPEPAIRRPRRRQLRQGRVLDRSVEAKALHRRRYRRGSH